MAPVGPPAWRLLVHPPGAAAWNMAVDDAILERYASSGAPAPPTLRLYGWTPAALSLGRGQRVAPDRMWLSRQAVQLVRRPTGGAAVLHERERTYAVIGALGREPFTGGVIETYRRVAAALASGLARLGVEATSSAAPPRRPGRAAGPPAAACFAALSTHEITATGGKLVGSAQLRRRRAFLQHGSIPLAADPARLAAALGEAVGGGWTDLGRELGREPTTGELDAALVAGFEAAFGSPLAPGELTPAEAVRAEQLRGWRYLSAAWTLEGRPGAREARWGPPRVR